MGEIEGKSVQMVWNKPNEYSQTSPSRNRIKTKNILKRAEKKI